jgi:hypothetical protein
MAKISAQSGIRRKRVFAVFALLVFCVFLGILLYMVPRLDLMGAILIGLIPAAYDVWDQLFKPKARAG